MKFTYENQEYRIVFSHFTENNVIPGIGYTDQRCTTARIYTGERGTDNEQTVADVKVTQFHKDQFSFEAGRKAALKAALEGFEYGFRTAAWNAYHSRLGGIHYQPQAAVAASC